MEDIQVVDISEFLKGNIRKEDIETVYKSFFETSALIIKDPRVTFDDNSTFIDTMEDYYNQPLEAKMKDVHPEWGYQIGATPENTENPRDHTEYIKTNYSENNGNMPMEVSGKDPKWRFFWPIGEVNPNTKFPSLNQPNVVPEAFADRWETVMNRWANFMIDAVKAASELLALGLGLDQNAFTNKMKYARHLLAPTGSDLEKYGKVGTVLAGFHYDLNFMTIHGKSRYPGLFIWTRKGVKTPVRVPDGCLLIQAAKELEWLTGGVIQAGFHEVIVNENTLEAVERQKKLNRPLWRVSSTLFSQIAADEVLEPMKEEWKNEKYPPVLCGDYVVSELKAIKLQ
ncbi:hypothetical protein ABK040_013635 [Willaertia magna]